MSSLTNEKQQIGQYVVDWHRNRWRFTGNQPRTRDRVFSVAEKKPGMYQVSWLSSGQSVPSRKQVKAESVEEAVELAEKEWYGDCTFVSLRGPEIHQVFEEWLDSLEGKVATATIDEDYEPRSNLFLKWVDLNGYVYWTDLFPRDVNRYASEGSEDRRSSAIEKRCRVIRMANKYVEENYPEFHKPLPYKLPKGKPSDVDRDTLRVEKAIDFLTFVKKQPYGWNTLPGFAIAVLTGDRVQGFRHARWSDVDWAKRTIALRNKPNIGLPSKRVIPIPGLLLDILWECFGRSGASLSDRILVTYDRFSYKQAFIRYRDKWCPGINLEPNGLRRTLFQESLLKKFYCMSLEMYLGHKPPQIPGVTWKHYLDRLRFEPDEVLKMFREDVVEPWDRVLEPFRRDWNRGGGNVVPLRA